MSKPKVSIIVPIYNVSAYLEKCLNSIINQTLEAIEIILVNDCSPDPLDHEICANYAERDNRIVYIKHEDNLGLSEARNAGIELAKANYITFVDSDDFIKPDMLKIIYEEAITNNRDIVIFGFDSIDEDNNNHISSMPQAGDIEGDLLKNFLENKNTTNPSVWNKLWKKSLFIDNNIRFPQGVYFEDVITTAQLLYFAKNVTFIDQSFYFYLSRKNSITLSFSKKHIDDIFLTYNLLIKFLTSINKLDFYRESLEGRIWEMFRYHQNTGLALATQNEKNTLIDYFIKKAYSQKLPDIHYYFPHKIYE